MISELEMLRTLCRAHGLAPPIVAGVGRFTIPHVCREAGIAQAKHEIKLRLGIKPKSESSYFDSDARQYLDGRRN